MLLSVSAHARFFSSHDGPQADPLPYAQAQDTGGPVMADHGLFSAAVGTVVQARKDHHRELQSLGRVQGHQRDHPALVVGVRQLVGVGHQGDPLQEVHQGRLGPLLGDRLPAFERVHTWCVRIERTLPDHPLQL
jgi:hypothetical protein